jgi:hypothetical protein
MYNSLAQGTTTAAGGTGGTGGAKLGTGVAGSNGTDGGAGKVVLINMTSQTVTIQ